MASDLVVVIGGIPGSGKTTLARALADELDLPLISKDTIKEALFDSIGSGDLEWSQRLGRAGHVVMYALVADMSAVILESHFWAGTSEPELVALARPLLQIYCRCPIEVAVERYQRRAASPDRHPGHQPGHQDDEATAHWRNGDPRPLDLPGPLIEVDTSGAVEIAALADQIRDLGPLSRSGRR